MQAAIKKPLIIKKQKLPDLQLWALRHQTGVRKSFQTFSFLIFSRVIELSGACVQLHRFSRVSPPPSQRSADPATPPSRGWSPPCSWAPWCRRWRRVWRSGRSRTPSLSVSSHRAPRREPEDGSNGSERNTDTCDPFQHGRELLVESPLPCCFVWLQMCYGAKK